MSNDVEVVKQRIDIVDYIGHKVQLKSAGRNFKGPCPFHQEKTPSFMVNPDLQIYKCFGCGEGGDIYNFIQAYEGVEFGEALKLAAEYIGYTLTGDFKKDEKLEKEKESLYAANKLAAQFWNYLLSTHKSGKTGRDYAQKRGIRREEIDLFKMGFAPPGTNLVPFLAKKGFQPGDLVKWGLAIDRDGKIMDKFRDRFMLPIMNMKGQVVGFSGRIMKPSDYAPKYLNSPETLVYKKSEILMGLYQAKDATRQEKVLILEEGNLDLMASHKVGVQNIAATGGTAITEQQLKLVKRYADKVIFCFDSDDAGTKALLRGIDMAEKVGLQHQVIDLGDYQDPDELIQAEPQKWSELIENAKNSLDYLFKLYQKNIDLGSPDGKTNYTNLLVPVIKSLRDEVQKNHFVDKLSLAVSVPQDVIWRRLDENIPAPKPVSRHQEPAPPVQADVKDTASNRETYFLALLSAVEKWPELEITPEHFLESGGKQIFSLLKETASSQHSISELADKAGIADHSQLQTVLTWDLEELDQETELQAEIGRIYKLLDNAKLRRELLDLRAKLTQNPDDEKLLLELQQLTVKLQNAAKNS